MSRLTILEEMYLTKSMPVFCMDYGRKYVHTKYNWSILHCLSVATYPKERICLD
ncbi:hypothetical protein VPHD292_0103 [Vibrio phage D292]